MKLLDAALLSLAIGLTSAGAYLFASDYPAGYVAVVKPAPVGSRAPRNRDFQAIVVHGPEAACRRGEPGSLDVRAHFVVHADGESGAAWVEPTERWLEQISSVHTRNTAVNKRSIAIWIDPPATSSRATPAQEALLRDLVRRLRAEFAIPPSRVFAHADVDVGTSCAAGALVPAVR